MTGRALAAVGAAVSVTVLAFTALGALVLAGCGPSRESARPLTAERAAAEGAQNAEPGASSGTAVGAGAPVSTAPALDGPATQRARIHPSLEEFVFTLVGTGSFESGAALHVTAIEVRRASGPALVQTIGGLDTQTPVIADTPLLDVLDMNFDGYADIRLVALQPAGPNVPYLNWVFDVAAGRFVDSPTLNEITAPVFDAARREIRSEWRDGPTRYGTDTYEVRDGRPEAVRREVKAYSRPGRYTLEVSRPVGRGWDVIERREVREP